MVTDSLQEVIFVGLPGPTHNYGGLSMDNVAAVTHRGQRSNPREAALQALSLVRLLKSLGLTAGILPPQLRPNLGMLRTKFSGDDDEIIREAAKKAPALLEKACSSSAMWAANAATVTAAIDNAGTLHLTTANLHTNQHRRIEADDTHRVLAAIFARVPGAKVYPPLAPELRDEGAANHMRLAPRHGEQGLNVYVFGTDGSPDDPPSARQTLEASKTVAGQHGVTQVLFVKQHPDLIRQGVFHNDVVAVANETVLLAHAESYLGGQAEFGRIEEAYHALHPGRKLHVIVIEEKDLSVEEAVKTYFFNSQIVTLADGTMAIIAPTEVRDLYGGKGARLMEKIRADGSNPIQEVHYLDLRQSMNNGGGPACLRLRVPMNGQQIAAIKNNVNVLADDALLKSLTALIEKHYPEKLTGQDLADPALYHRCRAALADISTLMKLPLL